MARRREGAGACSAEIAAVRQGCRAQCAWGPAGAETSWGSMGLGRAEEFGLYLRDDGESLEGFKPEIDMIRFIFLEDRSDGITGDESWVRLEKVRSSAR